MEKFIPVKLSKIFREFFQSQQASGYLLILATALSLAISNAPGGVSFISFWGTKIGIHTSQLHLEHSVVNWINDGLMTLFFLLVGIEIKRELISGELNQFRKAILPVIGAIGGMAMPALLFYILNHDSPQTIHGIGIPTATDIAFAIAILGLLGDRVPMSIKIFLTALAIIDDLGAIVVIAIFYGTGIHWNWLAIAALICAILLFLNYKNYTHRWIYVVLGILLWFCMLHSGIHATIAGVLFAFLLPRESEMEGKMSDYFEHLLHLPVSYVILPLFAMANTALIVDQELISQMTNPLSVGIFVGLFIGKPLGIFGFSWISVKLKLTEISSDVKFTHLLGAGILGGIGFTMSIFISNLAFYDILLVQLSKITILVTSIVAAIVGYLMFRISK